VGSNFEYAHEDPGSNYIWTIPVPNPNEPNSSLTYYVHLGSRNDSRLRVVGSLLVQILTEPAFNVLRTQEQLGYIVVCSQWVLPGDVYFGIRIVVQSERHPTYLEERVEAFLDFIKSKLETMPESEFLEQKIGLERKWREGAKNLVEEANRYWAHIDSGVLDFHRRVYFNLFTTETLANIRSQRITTPIRSKVLQKRKCLHFSYRAYTGRPPKGPSSRSTVSLVNPSPRCSRR
jgi:secreted Zn-dependent insulinase-like peptidase